MKCDVGGGERRRDAHYDRTPAHDDRGGGRECDDVRQETAHNNIIIVYGIVIHRRPPSRCPSRSGARSSSVSSPIPANDGGGGDDLNDVMQGRRHPNELTTTRE